MEFHSVVDCKTPIISASLSFPSLFLRVWGKQMMELFFRLSGGGESYINSLVLNTSSQIFIRKVAASQGASEGATLVVTSRAHRLAEGAREGACVSLRRSNGSREVSPSTTICVVVVKKSMDHIVGSPRLLTGDPLHLLLSLH